MLLPLVVVKFKPPYLHGLRSTAPSCQVTAPSCQVNPQTRIFSTSICVVLSLALFPSEAQYSGYGQRNLGHCYKQNGLGD